MRGVLLALTIVSALLSIAVCVLIEEIVKVQKQHMAHVRDMQATINAMTESMLRDAGKHVLPLNRQSAYQQALERERGKGGDREHTFGRGWKSDRIATPPTEGR